MRIGTLALALVAVSVEAACGSDSQPSPSTGGSSAEAGVAGAATSGGVSGGGVSSGGVSSGGVSTGGISSTGGRAGSGGQAGSVATGGKSFAGAGTGGESSLEGDAPTTDVTFEPSDETLLNPERGFYVTGDLADMHDLGDVREDGKTLVYAAAHLDEYLGDDHEQDLPTQVLEDVQAGFSEIRGAGLKAVVRFQYDDGEGYPDGANDASEATILRHIEQLTPVLLANRDVLFVLQAGFIGAWGEWHTSLNFSDGTGDQAARKRIVEALLAAVPGARVGVRYPAYKRMFYGDAATTEAALLAAEPVSLIGHVNDCFVSSEEDVGTYQYEPMDVLKDYLALDTAYAPIGGETCAEHERNACSVTVPEMERFHYSYINSEYHEDVIGRWESDGCLTEIAQRLGYRLSLSSAKLPEAARPGGTFSLEITLENSGFAALTNARPVVLVLSGEGRRHEVELPADPRLFLPGQNTIAARLRLPADITPGSYNLSLWLPDAAEALRERSEYSIQLANLGVWDEATGANTLGTVTISETAPGMVDPNASDAFELVD